jgi:hypothetical protein
LRRYDSDVSVALVVEALRETPFWDRYFRVVEILVGVENAYATNYGRDAIATIEA